MLTHKKLNDSEMLQNVRHSTQSALEALKHFEKSLIHGRFVEAVSTYETMCNTLLRQKIWSLDKNDKELDIKFDELAITAKNIVNILQPYVHNLEKLTQFLDDHQEKNQTKETNKTYEHILDSNESKIISILKKSNKNCSVTKLRSETRLDKKELERLLVKLESIGKIAITENRGRKLVYLLSS